MPCLVANHGRCLQHIDKDALGHGTSSGAELMGPGRCVKQMIAQVPAVMPWVPFTQESTGRQSAKRSSSLQLVALTRTPLQQR